MRALPPPGIVAVILGLPCVACSAERGLTVDVVLEEEGDELCLVASGAGGILFAQAYATADLPDGERSLTFVAGDVVHDELTITAMVAREGGVIGRATARLRFPRQGTSRQTMRPRRCLVGGPVGLGERRGGTFTPLSAAPHLLAADVDGDSREELLAIGSDGSLQTLDAEDRDAGSRHSTELVAIDGRLVASGDLDADCRPEIVAAASTGALVVIGADGRSPSPIGESANDVAVGLTTATGGNAIAIAGATSLSILPWDDDAPRMLAAGVFTHVLSAELTGDGLADLVAVSDVGTSVWVGEAGSDPRLESGALPAGIAAATGPIAIGDIDGDGVLDLASASANRIRIAINRGDGLLEERMGPTPTMVAMDIVRLELADLDGDCEDEIVALDAGGVVSVFGRDATGVLVARTDVPPAPVIDALPFDADGDGSREIALLRGGGSVSLWRP